MCAFVPVNVNVNMCGCRQGGRQHCKVSVTSAIMHQGEWQRHTHTHKLKPDSGTQVGKQKPYNFQSGVFAMHTREKETKQKIGLCIRIP